MRDDGLTNEELLQIAAEVERGERPQSDLDKYGISIGPEISGDEAKEMLLSELEALEAADDE